MPSIAGRNSSPYKEMVAGLPLQTAEIARSSGESTPQKRSLRSNVETVQESLISRASQRKSSRRCANSSPNAPGIESDNVDNLEKKCELPVKKLSADSNNKPNWNPMDMEQMSAVKEALQVSTAPSTVVCREDEQEKIFYFCKTRNRARNGWEFICVWMPRYWEVVVNGDSKAAVV